MLFWVCSADSAYCRTGALWMYFDRSDVRVAAAGDTAVVKCVWSGIYPANSLTPEGGVLQLLITDVWVRQGDDWVVLARHTSLPRPPQ